MPRDEIEELVISNLIAHQIVKIAVQRSMARIQLNGLKVATPVEKSSVQENTPATPNCEVLRIRSGTETRAQLLPKYQSSKRIEPKPWSELLQKESLRRPSERDVELLQQNEHLFRSAPTSLQVCSHRNLGVRSCPSGKMPISEGSRFLPPLSTIIWPRGRYFSLELGKQKIKEFIDKVRN